MKDSNHQYLIDNKLKQLEEKLAIDKLQGDSEFLSELPSLQWDSANDPVPSTSSKSIEDLSTLDKSKTPKKSLAHKIGKLIGTKPLKNLNKNLSPENYPYSKQLGMDYLTSNMKMSSEPTLMDERGTILFTEEEELQYRKEWETGIIKTNELVMKPSMFNGSEPTPAIWWEEYLSCAQANGWNEAVTVKYFGAYLSEAAKDWFIVDLQPTMIKRKPRLAELAAKFKENFVGEAFLRELSNEFEKLQQEPGESVSLFIPKARRMLKIIDPEMSEREQIRHITRKLRRIYVMDIAKFDTSTLERLRHVCLRIESGISDLKARDQNEQKNIRRPGTNTLNDGNFKKTIHRNNRPQRAVQNTLDRQYSKNMASSIATHKSTIKSDKSNDSSWKTKKVSQKKHPKEVNLAIDADETIIGPRNVELYTV